MGYFNTDAGEQRQRASIIDRRVELHERYGSKKPLDATHLADDFDRNLRARHDEFLDEVKPINVSWESPGFAALSTPALLAEVTEKVRSTRQTDHATARMGTVETSAGTIYWTIEKAAGFRDLFSALRKGSAFTLGVWHADDVGKEVTRLHNAASTHGPGKV